MGMFSYANYSRYLNAVDASYELLMTCIHEAGHAVLSYALGFGCSSITVFAETDGQARVAFGGRSLSSRHGLRAAQRSVKLLDREGALAVKPPIMFHDCASVVSSSALMPNWIETSLPSQGRPASAPATRMARAMIQRRIRRPSARAGRKTGTSTRRPKLAHSYQSSFAEERWREKEMSSNVAWHVRARRPLARASAIGQDEDPAARFIDFGQGLG